jgi:hypothetical protein
MNCIIINIAWAKRIKIDTKINFYCMNSVNFNLKGQWNCYARPITNLI